MRLRRAEPEDKARLHQIAAETPKMVFPKDLFAFPTVEVMVVEQDDGEIVGFGYLEAIPEAHMVMRRRGVSRKDKRHAIGLLHIGAKKVADALSLPCIRYPVTAEVPDLAIWISSLPNVQGDARTHLCLMRPGEQ